VPNIEWDVAMSLHTPGGNVDINTTTGRRYIVQSDTYKIVPGLRLTDDNISQQDGSVPHPRYKTGMVATMRLAFYVNADADTETQSPDSQSMPACATDLREMYEALSGALDSIKKFTAAEQRYIWTPSGYADDRMLDQIIVAAWFEPQYDLDGTEASVTFAIETPFPYALDLTQQSTEVFNGSGAGTTVTQNGNTGFWPVIEVPGFATDFTITNYNDLDDEGNPKAIVFDSSLPGGLPIPGGHFAEIDCFRGTIFEDGDGANLIGSLDPTATDFWQLQPGPNLISIVGADCTILWNNAWT
jgi:hypothetical protein